MKTLRKYIQLILLGGILFTQISHSEGLDEKSDKAVHRSLPNTKRKDSNDKDEKLRTASQNLFGYNNGFNNGFGTGVNGFSNDPRVNGYTAGVNNGVYPQGNYASSGLYNGVNYNQNGIAGYPLGFNGNNINGFGLQGQGVYSGFQQGYPNQGFQGGFNNAGGLASSYPTINAFGMPYATQGVVGVQNYQASGYPNGLYQGNQVTDRRANQYIGNGITVGNKIDVGGDGRSAGVSSSRNGRTNQPGFVAGQGFGLNYADQAYNILPGGVYNGNSGFGNSGLQGGLYRRDPYNQQLDFNSRYPNSGTNRFYQGTNPQGSFQQRIHRFVGSDTDRN